MDTLIEGARVGLVSARTRHRLTEARLRELLPGEQTYKVSKPPLHDCPSGICKAFATLWFSCSIEQLPHSSLRGLAVQINTQHILGQVVQLLQCPFEHFRLAERTFGKPPQDELIVKTDPATQTDANLVAGVLDAQGLADAINRVLA